MNRVKSKAGVGPSTIDVEETDDGLRVRVRRSRTDQEGEARELDKAYITARYPDALLSGSPRSLDTRAEGERMVAHVERVVRFCSERLSDLQP